MTAYDPMIDAGEHALFPGVTICADPLEALRDADAAVLVTEWAEFARLDWPAARERHAPAARHRRAQLPRSRDAGRGAGFEYDGVGTGDLGLARAPAARGLSTGA